MNQRQLRHFVAVCEAGNINDAAGRLFVSRQGLSKSIRLLEEELGQRLFTRGPRGAAPTDYAAALLPHAQRLLAEYEAIGGLNTLAAQAQSVVTVYALDHLLAYLGPRFVLGFHREHPGAILSVVDTTDDHAIAALGARQCDFALVTGPLDGTQFHGDPLFFTAYSVRMARSHPLARRDLLTYADLDGQSIVSKGRAYACFRKNIDRHILGQGRTVRILAETSDESVIRGLLLSGEAVNLGYDYADGILPHPGIISRGLTDGESCGQVVYLAAALGARPTRACAAFRDYLLRWCEGLPKSAPPAPGD
ncbi:MAG: LysR family transcriptional regulator [Succinivibrionaceae bacterium]|nr:LysR family transcriptional regulator [Succinivibrionaceae bacterium]